MIIVKGKIKLEKLLLELNDIDTENLFNVFDTLVKLLDRKEISLNKLELPEIDTLHGFSQFIFSIRENIFPYIDLNLVGLSEKNRLPDESENEDKN